MGEIGMLDERIGCGSMAPNYRKLSPLSIQIDHTESKKRAEKDGQSTDQLESKKPLSAEKALEILKRINDEDIRILGLDPVHARPEWMITQVVPVPPLPVRPTVVMGASGL